MPNRSLDDFAAGDTDEEAAEDETVDDETLDEKAVSDDETLDEKAVSDDETDTLATYRWTPTGTACPQCGSSVEKTWLDGEEYVCAECKNW